MIILLVMGFAALALVDVPKLIKTKSWRELAVYSLLMTLAFVMILLRMLDIEVPNPVKDTQYVVKRVFELLHMTYD